MNLPKIYLLAGCLSLYFSVSAQTATQTQTDKQGPTFYTVASSFKATIPLRDMVPVLFEREDNKPYIVPNKMRRNKFDNSKVTLPIGSDPVWQKGGATHSNKAPLQNWAGLTNSEGGATPPDPGGAAGPNHYVQMVNVAYKIFDKTGTVLYGPASLGSLLGGGNAGDPVVIYDKDADRWFLSQFDFGNNLVVAVSQTPDPLGAYYSYSFNVGSSFPDYPKYSVWSDGYYVTSNKSGNQCYVMERDKMIAGDPSAQMLGFTMTSIGTPGFFGTLPACAESALPPFGTPNTIFYFQDDGWSGVSQDAIKIWTISVNWTTTSSSTISSPVSIPVAAFDSQFTSSWDDITQPGSQKLDGIPGAFMFMAPYRQFSGYNSVVLNHTVDVDGTNHSGIRWYELRQTSGTWALYQQGTFAPDADSRWCGGIDIDYQGNIGLAYSVSGSSTYPSIRYTGRYSGDPLGTMTLAEQTIVNGTSSQSGTNRFGDYAQMTIDPTDDATFWYCGEYMSGGWKTRVASFKLATNFSDDVGVLSIDSPVDGNLTGSETVSVSVKNFGSAAQSGFPVSYTLNGGAPVTETYTGSLASGVTATFNFSATANMAAVGSYTMVSYTGLAGDQYNPNDTTTQIVTHTYPTDVGVSAITAPVSSTSLTGTETITITLNNYGSATQSNIPISYVIDAGTAVIETYGPSLAPGANTSYSFAASGDFSALGPHSLMVYTSLSGDLDNSNDTAYSTVEHTMCAPVADCSYGDGFTLFQLSTINNASGCSSGGYADYSSQVGTITQGQTETINVSTNYGDQHMTVWIDYNDNFTFETSEKVVNNYIFGTGTSGGSGSTTFNVSASAPLGQHLLRARTYWQNDINDPCIDVNYGETEDYSVNVVTDIGISEVYPDANIVIHTLGNGLFQVTISGIDATVYIEVHDAIGKKVADQAIGYDGSDLIYNLDLSDNAEGYYLLHIWNNNFSKVEKVVVWK